MGNIIGRITKPASEAATHEWLQQHSALGELLDYDFEGMAAKRLYEASDMLWKYHDQLEEQLYRTEKNLFSFEETVTLYDLTNTFFEGASQGGKLSNYGRSKEKRTDAPLVTLGLVLDKSGFPRSSRIFPGNASEPGTLETMLKGLNANPKAIIIVDAGIATEDNISWLKAKKYHYLVVSRKRNRQFDQDQAVTVKEVAGQEVSVQRVVNEETDEIELYCYSKIREKKEQAMQNRVCERFEEQLQYLHDGLSIKGRAKKYGVIMERIGRIKQRFSRAAQHYQITVEQDKDSDKAISIKWIRQEKSGSQATHPGVYCLRTDLKDSDESTLWHTYTMLTDLEAVFRSLKSELGLRPIYHQKDKRISGHLFISLLSYHLIHTLRTQLKAKGIHNSWEQLRNLLHTRSRITVTMNNREGKTIHVRKSTQAEPSQQKIYDALGISSQAGISQRTIF
ncbi:IS1634 family transposase [Candidatus Venteria ishoeyi]|uniref:IS1634 family transposase n=1 Tax=Candidatus Venteria ishoeyi TaxID=1899563 RepID=UPI0025A562FD|nr:IS1634 family transposase [Candidatus Venteria ishoeyi]MDM8545219.1 IS1634 family transposase [Candidatus Venteria ishoeyi]